MMRDPKRIPEVLAELGTYWMKHPDLRLGQIVENLATSNSRLPDAFYFEDSDLLEALRKENGNDQAHRS